MIHVVIPARYASERLPGKPLRDIAGLPMVVRTLRQAEKTGWPSLVACDDQRIADAVNGHGGKAVLTALQHSCGTSRLLEAAELLRLPDEAMVVNVQGDEPLMPVECIRLVAETLAQCDSASVATLATPFRYASDIADPTQVKVVVDDERRALYFSRSVIPYARACENGIDMQQTYLRHLGIYAYRVSALRFFCSRQASVYEEIEKLEQLRFLAHGVVIKVAVVEQAPPPGVDTQADLARVCDLLNADDENG